MQSKSQTHEVVLSKTDQSMNYSKHMTRSKRIDMVQVEKDINGTYLPFITPSGLRHGIILNTYVSRSRIASSLLLIKKSRAPIKKDE